MAPKAAKKKKKTKEELETERLAAEEEKRRAEEGVWTVKSPLQTMHDWTSCRVHTLVIKP